MAGGQVVGASRRRNQLVGAEHGFSLCVFRSDFGQYTGALSHVLHCFRLVATRPLGERLHCCWVARCGVVSGVFPIIGQASMASSQRSPLNILAVPTCFDHPFYCSIRPAPDCALQNSIVALLLLPN